MGKLTFEEFKSRVIDTWQRDLKPMGYDCEMFEAPLFNDNSNDVVADYWVHFSRWNPKTQRKEFTLNLNYNFKEGEDFPPFEINQHFEDISQIPECYGDLSRPEYPTHAPMFIYGQYKRFGDALNALKKGDSLNGRKYVELYY